MIHYTLHMSIGVLALQGDFAEHIAVLRSINVEVVEVRSVADLETVDRLIIPGGESTTMLKLLASTGLDVAIKQRHVDGSLPVFGTCAGAIVAAALGLIDIEIDRNAYGSQLQSFQVNLTVDGIDDPLSASFIRAPMITKVGSDVTVLAEHDGHPALVRSGFVLVSTFHPEVHGETRVHQLWLDQ